MDKQQQQQQQQQQHPIKKIIQRERKCISLQFAQYAKVIMDKNL